MTNIKKMEDHAVYKWLDKTIGRFRMGWLSGFLFFLCLLLAFKSTGLLTILPVLGALVNFSRFADGR